jgi:signal transduction histidine kinase
VIDAMRRHVDRELARARVRTGAPLRSGAGTRIAPLVRSLIATVSRTSAGARIAYEAIISDRIDVPFDRTDLAEVLGNLLENATRHARMRVRISVPEAANGMEFRVEDDGPGIAPQSRSAALARGGRLDQRGEGTGLGLAIVQDVLEAYGWSLHLEASDLGGLRATCRVRGSRPDSALEAAQDNAPARSATA